MQHGRYWTTKPVWLFELVFHRSLTWPFCTLACRLDGAAGGPVTVTFAWAFRPLAETFTWEFPVPLAGAVYSPVLLMVPPPPPVQPAGQRAKRPGQAAME